MNIISIRGRILIRIIIRHSAEPNPSLTIEEELNLAALESLEIAKSTLAESRRGIEAVVQLDLNPATERNIRRFEDTHVFRHQDMYVLTRPGAE